MYVEQSQPFEAVYADGTDGLVGTVEVAVFDGDGNTVIGPTTTNITEEEVLGTPIGIYTWNAPAAPALVGQYTIAWSPDGTWDPVTTSTADELVVVAADASGFLPPIPSPADDGTAVGPCSVWTTSLAVSECCGITNSTVVDEAIIVASQLLYAASGRQFAGICQDTVRPCVSNTCGCGFQVLSRGHLVGWTGDCWGDSRPCGCRPVSEVPLAGPVREIVEVMIDGVVIDPDMYLVRDNEWLVRKNGALWPSCQSMDVDDDDVGAFAVTYTTGKIPPGAAQYAARALACEISKSCTGADDCALPFGATRITRQGITIEKTFMNRDANGVWSTGIPLVDIFLNALNPHGLQRRAIFFGSSSRQRYGRRIAS